MRFLLVLFAVLALALADEVSMPNGFPYDLYCTVDTYISTIPFQMTDEQRAKHTEDVKACTQQEGVTREQAIAMRDGHFENVDAKSKCFTKCVLERMGVLANDKLVADKLLETLGPIDGVEKTKNLINICGSIKGTDQCDTGYLIYICFHKNRME